MAKFPTSKSFVLLIAVLLFGAAAIGATKKSSSSTEEKKKSVPAKTASKSTTSSKKKTASKTASKSTTSSKKKTASKPASSSKKKAAPKVVAKPAPKPAPTPPPLAPGELPLVARAAVLLDAKTGDVLYEKNADELEYPASATKILTALLIIEQGDLDKKVTIEVGDTKVEPSALEVKPGEEYARKELLYALLLKSANDVALCLARDNAGSVDAFSEKMNRRAEELGAVCSHFTNPHGLHDPHHFTTARDLAAIARAAMQQPLFREIVATPEMGMVRGAEWVLMRNHNKLLWRLPGCTGVKTGYTRAAQQVLVGSAIRAGREAISVVLHSDRGGIWEDSKTLLEHGFAKLGIPNPEAPAADGVAAPVAQGSSEQ